MNNLTRLEHMKHWRIVVGLLVFVLFILSSMAVNKTVQALTQAAGNYGYYNGTYGYNSTASSDFLPSAPTNFTLGARSANQITFTWTAPTTTTGSTSLDNLSNYTVAYGTGTVDGCNDGSQTTTSTASATLTSLNAGTTYNIAICATDTNLNDSDPLTGSITTLSSGSSGGGGGGSPAASTPATPATPATPTVESATPASPSAEPAPAVVATQVAVVSVGTPASVSVGGSSHTVTVASATATAATMTIASDPVTVTVKKDQSVDVDTDANGINDLRVTYNGLNSTGKPEFTFAALEVTLGCTMPSGMGVSPVSGAQEAITAVAAGNFIKSSGFSTVYYVTTTCGRRAFMDSQTYFTWTADFDRVKTVSNATLSALPLQGVMLPKHNVVLMKIQSDPKVYAITETSGNMHKPTLRWVSTEAVAKALYGNNWADYVVDVPATLFPRFSFGDAVLDAAGLSADRNLLKKRVDLN